MVDEAQVRFGRLLDDAAALPDHLHRFVAARITPGSVGDATANPLTILLALEPWAATQYRAGIALLHDPRTASAADVLVRGLLELFAHVFWVHEAGTREARECRAVCFAQGIVRTVRAFLKQNATRNPGAEPRLRELEILEREIQRQRERRKCPCKARKYGDVGPTLRAASQRPDLTWTFDTWAWTSTVAHQLLPVLSDPNQGLAAPLSASFTERGVLLSHFLHVFVNFGIILLETEQPEGILTWRGLANGVVASEVFKDAVAGRLD